MLRETIWSIHQESITLEELCNKAKSYATRIFENTSVRVDLEASERDYIFSPAMAHHLFRIIQESRNNACKYASASEVMITISLKNISIKENGKGFEVETVQKGYGLQNLAQRKGYSRGVKYYISSRVWNENGNFLLV